MIKPAVFLDRDGVLCPERGYLHTGDELQIFPFAADSVKILHEKNFLAIVITNQSAVARGFLDLKDLERMNKELQAATGVDAVYYCPHLNLKLNLNLNNLEFNCDCRKPKTGMIRQACEEFEIDLSNSWLVGDRAVYIQTGINAGLKTALLESGYGSKKLEFDVKPDYIFNDLKEFAEFL